MVPNVFEPLKFYCGYYFYRCYTKTSLFLVNIHLDERLAPPALNHGVACSGRVGGEILSQLKEHLIAQRYPVWQHTFVSPSAFSRRAVVSYWRKYVHKVLVNRLGGLSLPRKSVVRLTDRPDMTWT